MAFEKEERRVGVTAAKIGVTRGRGAARVGAQIGQSNVSSAINNFLSTQVQELKQTEEAKGEKLAKQAELVYEDYTDENGVTTKIATNYKTPEHLLTTSWATNSFDEEVVGHFLDGAMVGVSDLIEKEKMNMKSAINVNTDVATIPSAFENNLKDPLSILENNIPKELKALYEQRKGKLIKAATTEIANKHISFRDSLNHSTATHITNEVAEILTTMSFTDNEEAQSVLNKYESEMGMLSLKSYRAAAHMEQDLPGFKASVQLGKSLSDYIVKDFTNIPNTIQASNNITEILKVINLGPGAKAKVVSLVDGKEKIISFKSLGIKDKEHPSLKHSMRISLTKLNELIQSKAKNASKSARVTSLFNKSYDNKIPFFTEKADIKDASKRMLDANDALVIDALGKYNKHHPEDNLTPLNFNLPEKNLQRANYIQWFANTTGVVPEGYKDQAHAVLASTDQRALEAFVGNPVWNLLSGTPIVSETGTAKVYDLFATIGLDEEAEKNFSLLKRKVTQLGGKAGVAEYLNIIDKRPNELYDMDTIILHQSSYKTEQELNEGIQKKILDEFDTFGFLHSSADDMVTQRFINEITKDVKTSLKYDSKSEVSNLVSNAVNKIKKYGSYGYSDYIVGTAMWEGTGGEIDLAGGGRLFTRFPPDPVLQTKAQWNRIKEKIDTAHSDYKKEDSRGGLKVGGPFVFGENLHLQIIGNPATVESAAYRFVYSDNDGGNPQFVIDKDGNQMTVTYRELLFLQKPREINEN